MATTTISAPGSASPSSSPRLPSPPPFPEVQIGPKSPIPGATGGSLGKDVDDNTMLDTGSTRRIRPGTKSSDMASGPPLVPLQELDSPFQLQEHLKALYHQATKSEQNNTTIPITRETAMMLATPPENVDRPLWLYELCRFLVQKANNLIVGFFSDTPPCSAQNCPEMRASEWQYLCAVHDPPKSCCAIDYCCHTLDWAANILTSQKHFPSRLTLGSDAGGGSQQSVRQLTNIFRRVYRMFAHAWFQHRDVFWVLEGHEGLYIFYKTVCDVYCLIPEDNYTVPREAEGLPTESNDDQHEEHDMRLERSSSFRNNSIVEARKEELAVQDEGDPQVPINAATTRRHKHTPSTGSMVTTIAESDEEVHESQDDNTPLEATLLFDHAQPTKSPPKETTRKEVPSQEPAPYAEQASTTNEDDEKTPVEAGIHSADKETDIEADEKQSSEADVAKEGPAIEAPEPPTEIENATTREASEKQPIENQPTGEQPTEPKAEAD